MVLTEEQKERIRKNRERALQIQKQRREEREKKERNIERSSDFINEVKEKPLKKQKTTDSSARTMSQSTSTVEDDHQYRSEAPLEDFEEGASEWVSKTEAMTMYCLPEGTMAVCLYEEKENPRNPKFKPMKLYKRSEIRYRAHKRHGGLEGLIKERKKRRQRKLEKDMEEARDIFKWE